MALEQGSHFRVDDWLVEPEFDRISRGDEQVTIRPRETDLLSYLASRAGQVVSAEEILEHVWAGVVVGSDAIYYSISQLRKALGDDPHEPRYLSTVPKRGYCLIAPVQYLDPQVETSLAPSRRIRSRYALSIMALVILSGIAITYVVRDTSAIGIRHPIAVMPFVDLSPAGDQEWFAQGIVVELSNAMDNVEGLHVADRRSTEAVANRGLVIEEIGQLLGVKQILEGSVRQDRQNVRIAVQLVDTSTGVRLWSEIYERELSDIFAIQEDIADQVTNRLRLQVPDAGAVTLTSRRTDPQTYNDFLRALGSEGTYSGRREAVRLLHEVITNERGQPRPQSWAVEVAGKGA